MTWICQGVGIALCAVCLCNVGSADTAEQVRTRPAYMVLDPNAPRPAVTEGEPVPSVKTMPAAPRRTWGVPSVRSSSSEKGERIELANDAMRVMILIDAERHVQLASIRTASGVETLAAPSACMAVVDEKGGVVTDGAGFVAESWMPRQHTSYSDVEIRLGAPVPPHPGPLPPGEREKASMIWRLRLYRDKPYLEQTFGLPDEWRGRGNAVAQVLATVGSMKPVMPNNAFGKGFSEGRPNISGRHRFEFVSQSDHLCYDPGKRAGLAAFVAGIGGEERVQSGAVAMLDHVVAPFDASEPVARFILWPFDGAVENGFTDIRRFVGGEYSCQRGKYMPYTWNQFWLWQGGIQPAKSEVVTCEKLLDILPQVTALGLEEFHLDAGWEVTPGDWRFDPKRFPQGFEPLRRYLRENGLRYHTWIATDASDDPQFLSGLIEQTDMVKLFHDRTVNENTVKAMREVRKRYPDFETFVHHSTSRSKPYWWGNIHFLSDFNQIYFGEGEFWAWSNVLPEKPEGDVNQRFFSKHSLRAGDLVTRSAAYQVHWAWPYTSIVPPHCGWAWFEDRDLPELASRMFTTLAARADYQWGEDPRLLRPEVLNFFVDWTAFFKAARPYLQEYQHVLPVPDGINPDGAAHIVDGRGFVILCNPGAKEANVSLKDLLWEPELELDPTHPVELFDWTNPLSPKALARIELANPKGVISMEALSYKVLSINVNVAETLAEVKRQRERIQWPPR